MNAYTIKSRQEVIASDRVRGMSRHSQRGFGIIEIGIVLVIVSMMLAVTLSYVRGTLANNRANEESREISQIILNIQRLYANRSTFGGTSTTINTLINNGVFPIARVSGTGASATIVNRWGGTVAMAAAPTTTMVLTYPSVPSAECNALVSQLEGLPASITVGSTAVKAAVNAQVDIAALGTACNNASNSVIYTFGLGA